MKIVDLTPNTLIKHICPSGLHPAPLVTREVRLSKIWVNTDLSSFELHGTYTDDGSEFIIGDYDANKDLSEFPYLAE